MPLEDAWQLMTRLAYLRESLEPTLDSWAVEILYELLAMGMVHESARIWALDGEDARTAAGTKIAGSILDRSKPATSGADTLERKVTEWMKDNARGSRQGTPERATKGEPDSG